MNGINAIRSLPFVAPLAFEPRVAVTGALASVAEATERTSAVARTVFDQFVDVINYSVGIAPLLVALMATMGLVRQMISLHKARLMGLTQDVRRVAVEACSHFLNLARCLISSISTLIQFSKIIPVATVATFSTVAGAISCLIYSLHAVVEGVQLYRTMQITSKWDDILQDGSKKPEEKICALLLDLDERFSRRELQNKGCLATLNQETEFQKRAENFLEEQAKEELEKVLGKNAYQKIREVVQAARRDGFNPTAAPEMVIKLQEAREHLQTKIKQHVINIVIDVVAVAATVLGIIFPYVGVGLLCTYLLWTVFCVLFTVSTACTIQEWWKARALSNFAKERNSHSPVYEKVLKSIRKRIPEMNLASNHTEMLLSKERTKEFLKRIRAFTLKPEKMRILRQAPDSFLIEALRPCLKSPR